MLILISLTLGMLRTLRSRIVNNDDPTKWEMPYGAITIFDMTSSPNYEIGWLYQMICVSLFSIMISSIDLIIAGVMAHISTQCKMLQNSLRRMIENAYDDMLADAREVFIFLSNTNKYNFISYFFFRKEILIV